VSVALPKSVHCTDRSGRCPPRSLAPRLSTAPVATAADSDDTFLQPNDPLFVTLGARYHKLVLSVYGDPTGAEAPFFNADQWNEMVRAPPPSHGALDGMAPQ
jgi:hypothetical protein